jgi:integrase
MRGVAVSTVRQTRTGSWEVDVRSKLLPRRRSFLFDAEDLARAWASEVDKLLAAGIVPPQLAEAPKKTHKATLLGPVIRAYLQRGPSASDEETLGRLFAELAHVKLDDITFAWCEKWVRDLKMVSNLAPGTIRKRVGALSRVLDWHLRSNPGTHAANPLHLLPRGYSTYTKADAKFVSALGGTAKVDVVRDRRLLPEEEKRIREALLGKKREGKERPLTLPDGQALHVLFDVTVGVGTRLREGYMIRLEDVDFGRKTLRIRQSKEWHGRLVFRDVPMRREVHDALVRWVQHRHHELGSKVGLLFPFWDGNEDEAELKRISSRLSHRFTDLFSYAGCTGLSEHDLRHEATCRWFELRDANGNWMFRSEEISKFMGWKPGSRMAQRYASFRSEDFAARLWQDPAPEAQAASGSGGSAGGAARRRKRAPE